MAISGRKRNIDTDFPEADDVSPAIPIDISQPSGIQIVAGPSAARYICSKTLECQVWCCECHWPSELNLSSIFEYSIKLADLDLLQVAQTTGGAGEPEIGIIEAGEVLAGEVAGQCASLLAIKRIAQRLKGHIP